MTAWTQPNSWAERKLQAIAEASDGGKPYAFETSCVASTAELIDEMIRLHREVDLVEVREHCDLTAFEQAMGYAEDTLSLEDDWHVYYAKSIYNNRRCYYIVHSAIEYIWVVR